MVKVMMRMMMMMTVMVVITIITAVSMSSCLLFAQQQIEHPQQLKHSFFTPGLHQARVIHHQVRIDLSIKCVQYIHDLYKAALNVPLTCPITEKDK